MSFVRRLIDVTFIKVNGTFAESGTNTVKVQGLRVMARIVKAGGPSMGTAQVSIFGLSLSLMNQLSTLGMLIDTVPRNVIKVEAYDEGGTPSTVFVGTITSAWGDFRAQPQVAFQVSAHTLGAAAVDPATPLSYPNGANAATVLSGLATLMGTSFENNGVQVQLPPGSYYWGSARQMALQVVREAGIFWNGGDNGVLAIWPAGGSRGGQVPVISADTGMKDYPSFTTDGVAVTTVFNPDIGFGNKVKIESTIDRANGTFLVLGIEHELDSLLPNGSWFSNLRCYNPANPNKVLG